MEISSMAAEKLAYSPQEAAMTLGLCLNTVYKLIKNKRLKSVKLDRKILIARTEIERFLRPEGRVTGTTDKT
jgi:excisionase family DNA binding protein